MTEKAIKLKENEYRHTSNLVYEPDRTIPRIRDDATGEAEPLSTSSLAKMGERHYYSKPTAPTETKKSDKRKREFDTYKTNKTNKKFKKMVAHDINLLSGYDEAKYHPSTRESKVLYSQLLSYVQDKLGDYDDGTIYSASEEILHILKSVEDQDKKTSIQAFIPSITEEELNNLLNISKNITDYTLNEDIQMEDVDEEKGLEKEDVTILMNDEKEEVEQELDEIHDTDESSDEEDIRDDNNLELEETQENLLTHKISNEINNEDKDILKISEINGQWIQKELETYYNNPDFSLKLSKEILNLLSESDDSILESRLVHLLGPDKITLIKKLLKNRSRLFYIIQLKLAQTDEERIEIENKMKNDIDNNGPKLLEEYYHKDLASDWNKQKETQIATRIREESKRLRNNIKDNNNNAVISNVFSGVSTTVNEIKEKIDLESLAFAQGGHLMSNRDIKLPEGSMRKQCKGYEEIHVPLIQAPPLKDNEKLKAVRELPEWARASFEGMNHLNRIQSKLYEYAMFSPDNMLLCAPTGAGKTNVAVLTILHEIGLHRREDGSIDVDKFKIVYIAPMKALVQEIVLNFGERFKPYGITVRELSGDAQMNKREISETQIIVTTPEKWDIITRKNGERTYTQLVRLVIFDEIHLLHDDRGPVIECIVARILRQIEMTQEMVRLVGLSATLPNYPDVAAFLRVDPSKGLFYFDNSFRPVPLQQCFIGITEKKPYKRIDLMNQICYEKCLEDVQTNQVLIFVHARKETGKTAKAIRDRALNDDKMEFFCKFQSATQEILKEVAEDKYITDIDLKELLPVGFAIHHAGLSKYERSNVESLFADGHIRVLVSTMTLAWGVNLPAHTVIIKGTQMYSPEKGEWVEISLLDVMQMMGRAGRPQYDNIGEGIIITSYNELNYYLSLTTTQLPIESQLIAHLPDNLNAEIVMGTIQNIDDAIDWLGYTYLYIRMLENPVLYGMSPGVRDTDAYLLQRRIDIIHSAAIILSKQNLIHYDKRSGGFLSTPLGKVSSHYYITHYSMEVYNERLKPYLSEVELFKTFSNSYEFRHLVTREPEKLELDKLITKVPIPIKESIEEPSTKINVLLQAYISRLSLRGSALLADMSYIYQSAGRILRALFEIALHRSWSSLAIKLLILSINVQHRLWYVQNPLRQYPLIAPETGNILSNDRLKRIEKKDIPWETYFDLNSHDLYELVRSPQQSESNESNVGKQLYDLIHKFPRIGIKVQIQPITRNTLKVECILVPNFTYDFNIHGFSESFHIFVEDGNGQNILHYEYFILKEKHSNEEHTLNFTVTLTDPLPPNYFIRILSDRWLHSETLLPISFRQLVLPEKYPPHTELIDHHPLPITALKNQDYISTYPNIQVFNTIQTQVFSVLYEDNENILIAAPSGSGKSICAEIALLRLFNLNREHNNNNKAIYMCPYQISCELKHQRLCSIFKNLDKVISILTGDNTTDLQILNKSDIIICTPNQWDMISRRWKQKTIAPLFNEMGLFIVDDLHLVGGEIGPIIEIVLSRMILIKRNFNKLRIVSLSCSLTNANIIGQWLFCKPYTIFNFQPSVRPVPLDVHLKPFDINHFGTRMLAMAKPAYNSIISVSKKEPVIVFVPNRKQTQLTSIDLLTYSSASNEPMRFLLCSKDEIEKLVENIQDPSLKHTLSHGIGFYHEGMLQSDKSQVLNLYLAGKIQILVVTASLVYSLSLHVRTVVIMDTCRYDGKTHKYEEYPISDILKMMGFASRPGIDDKGICIILCHINKNEFYKKFLYEPLPVESHLGHFLADYLNAEIVTKSITTIESAVDALTWTLYYRRLSQNPNYYGMPVVTTQYLSEHLSELIELTINDLIEAKCIEKDESGTLSPLNLGLISAHYYISYETIKLFEHNIKDNIKIKSLIQIISESREYSELIIRHGENNILKKIANHLPLPVDVDPNRNYKANILLQSHFSRSYLPPDLVLDLNEILQTAPRFIQALVDVISSNSWLNPALEAMELSQMIIQGLWFRDSPLLQIPYFDNDIIDQLKSYNVTNVLDILDLDDEVRNKILPTDQRKLSEIAKFCNNFPNIEVVYDYPDTVNPSDNVKVKITLTRDVDESDLNSGNVGSVLSVRYPYPRIENYWVVLGDPSNNLLIAIRRIPLKHKAVIDLNFNAPGQTGKAQYQLYIMSDSYIGCDQVYNVVLNVQL